MKNKNLKILITLLALYLGAYIGLILVVDIYVSKTIAIWIISIVTALVLTNFVVFILAYRYVTRKREKIKKSFDYYVDTMVASTGVGLVTFNSDGQIVWTSKFISDRVKDQLIGKSLSTISPSFKENYEKGEKLFQFETNKIRYEAQVDYENKAISIKDITNESIILENYTDEKLVVGELEIDNFQQFQLILAPEDLFRIQSEVISMLDSLSEKVNLSYRQYVNGKFILITNNKSLNELKAKRFNFLDALRKVNVVDGVQLSASIGFGRDSIEQKKLVALAKDGLMQSQSRGGDQVALISTNKKPEFFGSKSEIAKTTSRTKIRQVASLLEKTLEKKEIKNVVIFGHKFADLDAVGAALGIAALSQAYNKNTFIQNITFDDTTKNAKEVCLAKEEEELFVSERKINKLLALKSTVVVMVDTAEEGRTESPDFMENIIAENLFVFDHHRVSSMNEKILSPNSYIDTTASSASEIVTEVIQFMKKSIKIPKSYAQMMLNGIFLDTMQFQKATSSRTFQAAAFLENHGALASLSTELLKNSEDDAKLIAQIVSAAKEVKPGYYVASYQGEVGGDIISKAADEILRTSGRKAAFAIAKIPKSKKFKLSARGLETNVQIIAEAVGGGGHFGAAAAVSDEPLNIFTENIVQAIVTMTKEDK